MGNYKGKQGAEALSGSINGIEEQGAQKAPVNNQEPQRSREIP